MRSLRFDGNRVGENVLSEDERAEFEHFEAIAGAILQQFRDQAQQREDLEREQRKQDEISEALE